MILENKEVIIYLRNKYNEKSDIFFMGFVRKKVRI